MDLCCGKGFSSLVFQLRFVTAGHGRYIWDTGREFPKHLSDLIYTYMDG